jgi:hypothetical protein
MKPIIAVVAAIALLPSPALAQGRIKAVDGDLNIMEPDVPRKDATKSEVVSFRTCKDARAAGYSRMRIGEPGYARHLDRDNDGIACE